MLVRLLVDMEKFLSFRGCQGRMHGRIHITEQLRRSEAPSQDSVTEIDDSLGQYCFMLKDEFPYRFRSTREHEDITRPQEDQDIQKEFLR